MKKLSVLIFFLFFGIWYGYGCYTYSPIPKIIHYVWLGKHPLPEHVRKMIASWQTNAPDYKIIRWDETNCDIDANHYVKWAYKTKLWAFASDWCRLQALHKYGGLYLDTDHELTQNPSHLFYQTDLVMTYEEKEKLSGSFIAVKKGHPFIKSFIEYYKNLGPNNLGIPTHLTNLYNNNFKHPLNGLEYKSKELSLLPTNIAMINFGGDENVAIHHYDGTDSKYKHGIFYNRFKEKFLTQVAIPVCINNKKYSLILSNSKNGYFYETLEKVKILEKTDVDLTIKIKSKTYPLHLKNNCFSE